MTGRGLLLAELETLARSCCRLGRSVESADLDYRPNPAMRSLLELGNAVGSSLLVDARILSGAQADEIRELEDSLWSDNPAAWCDMLRDGYEQLRRFMEELSFDQYENGSSTAFYGRTQTHASWLLEIIRRLCHRRAQLHTYLQLLEYKLDASVLED